MALETSGLDQETVEVEDMDQTNPFSSDSASTNPFSEEMIRTIEPLHKSANESTNPFEDSSDIILNEEPDDLPTIVVDRGMEEAADGGSSSTNPFEVSLDAEDLYGSCYKEISNPVGEPDDGKAVPLEGCRQAENIDLENKDGKFGKNFTATQMRKRKSTIRRMGSLRKTPCMKAFRCPKEFCGFFASSADKLAIHVDRFHGAYHDLLSPESPELTRTPRKNSPVCGVKRLSEIMWGTMTGGNICEFLIFVWKVAARLAG